MDKSSDKTELEALRVELKALRGAYEVLSSRVDSLSSGQGGPAGAAGAIGKRPPSAEAPPLGAAILPPPPLPPPPLPLQAPSSFESRLAKSLRGLGAEQVIGEKLLNYVGMALIVLGSVFFMMWQLRRLGPAGKVALGLGVGAALAAAGEAFRNRPATRKFGLPLVGGGWAIVYYTLYAAHHVVVPPVLASARQALVLMALASAGLITHARLLRSRAFLAYAFGLIYLSFWIAHTGLPTLFAALLVTATAVYLGTFGGAPHVLPVSVAGFYLNYLHAYQWMLRAGASQDFTQFPYGSFVSATAILVFGYLMPVAAVMLPRPRRALFKGGPGFWADATLSASSVLFSIFVYSQCVAYLQSQHFVQGLALSALLAALGMASWLYLPKDLALQRLLPLLAAAYMALGAFHLHDPVGRLWVWTCSSAFWAALGLAAAQPYFRLAGAATALLIPAFYWHCRWSLPTEEQAWLSSPLFVYSGLAYVYGYWRAYVPRFTEKAWEKHGEEIWFALATVFLGLALWSILDPPSFAVAMIAAALAMETFSVGLDRPALWVQAAWLAPAVAVYTFFIHYGTETPVLGVSPRILVALPVACVLAYLRYFDPLPEAFAAQYSRKGQRQALGWLLAAILAYTAYQEHFLGPRLKMPVHAMLAVAAYLLGRVWKDSDLRFQAYVLALLAIWEGVVYYVSLPPAALESVTQNEAVLYWISSLSLLAPLAFPATQEHGAAEEEASVPAVFSAISLALLGAYLYKESQGYTITVGWSVLGSAYLAGGLLLDIPPLRHPALGLLGLCVLKAIFYDMAGLDLPYRVASYMVLGVALVASSYLYVSHGRKR